MSGLRKCDGCSREVEMSDYSLLSSQIMFDKVLCEDCVTNGRTNVSEEQKQPQQEKEPTPHDRLHDFLVQALGQNWRHYFDIPMRADHLSWMVFLAQAGLEYKRKQFKESGDWDAAAIASLASWEVDLSNWVDTIIRVVSKPGNKPKEKKSKM